MKKMAEYFKKDWQKTAAVLFLIIVLGMTLRLYNLGYNSFIADEYLDMNSAYGYRMTHSWQAWDFNFGKVNTADVNSARDERASLYKWQVAQIFKLLAPTEQNARLVSVFWGLVSILLIYFAAISFTGKKQIGLLSAFLFAVSAMGIMFDRKLRMYAMFYPMYLAFSLMLFLAIEKAYEGKNWLQERAWRHMSINMPYLVLAAIFGYVSYKLQLLTVNIFSAVFGYVLVQLIIEWKRKKKLLCSKYAIATALMAAGTFLAITFLPSVTGIFVASIKLFINNSGYFEKILSDYSNWMIGVVFFCVGAVYLFKVEKREKEAVWLLTSILVPLLMAAFMWKRTQGIQYVFFLQSFLIILIASGIYASAAFFSKKLGSLSKKAYWATIFLALLILPNHAYFFEDNNTYHRTDVGNYRKVFLYVRKSLKPGDVMVTRNFRNYYLSGTHTRVVDFGGESAQSDFSFDQLKEVISQNPRGWIVLFDNDDLFLTKEARMYVQNNLSKIDNVNVRGAAEVYYWGK